MNSIVYIGMDVHKESYTLCCFDLDTEEIRYKQKFSADYSLILKYVEQLRSKFPTNTEFVCGYEAGCLGYSLYHQLTQRGLKCIIMAPTTMGIKNTGKIKTDKRDAGNIARCLAYHSYSEVHVPTDEDNSIKEYIRMRDDQKINLKKTKQQILALVLRLGKKFEGGKSYWTIAHMKWLRTLKLGGVFQETLDEYLITYEYFKEKIKRLDQRIEELAAGESYQEKVKKLGCLIGVKAHTALSMIVEVGDFERFAKPGQFTAFLGLVPSEESSDEKRNRFSITKAGNSHLRRLLVEAAQAYTRGRPGHKSIALRQRQQGNTPQVIAYADKANERLRRRFYKMIVNNRMNRNVATTAIARELACFMWGLMTNNVA